MGDGPIPPGGAMKAVRLACCFTFLLSFLAFTPTTNLAQTAHFSGVIRTPGSAAIAGLSAAPDTQATNGNFGAVNVGAASASPVALVFTFDVSVTVGSTAVLTQGAKGLDFTNAGGTCKANTAYNAGDTCTVKVTFKPRYPGTRYGAAELLGTSGNLLATGYVQGTGVGPLVTFANSSSGNYLPSSQITLGNGFDTPRGVAVDGSGNVVVADSDNNAVKEIMAAGGYTTVKTLGDGFHHPEAVAVDGSGNVFVADSVNGAVKEILAAGNYTTVNTLSSGFYWPQSVAVDGSGNVYVTDGSLDVTEIMAAGGYSTVNVLWSVPWVKGQGGPSAVAVDGSGNVFVTLGGSGSDGGGVYEIMAAGGYTTIKYLSRSTGDLCVAVDGSGNLFVGSYFFVAGFPRTHVREIRAAGGYTTVNFVGSGFDAAFGVAVDGAGNLVVVDAGNSAVKKLDYADPPPLTFADTTVGDQSSDSPQTLTVSNNGNADLTLPVPASGDNPVLSGEGFTLDAATTCPQLNASSTAATLAVGARCDYAVDFIPPTLDSFSGSLTLTDNSLNASPAVTQAIPLTGKAVAPHLAFTTPPLASVASDQSPGTVIVSVEDSNNIVVTTSSATVKLTVTGPNSYSRLYTATAVSGVATFSGLASLSTAGSYSYTARDNADGFTEAVANESVIAPHLVFTTPPPASLTSGHGPGTVAVSVEDASNNVVTTSSATIKLSVTGPNSYAKVYTATAAGGVATFSNLVSLSAAGSYSYTATDTADGFIQALATESVIAPHLAFITAPPASLQVKHSPGTVTVSIEDPGNNVITTSSATVRLTVTGPNSYFKAYTATASGGVATFSSLASLSTVGSYTYTALDNADGFTQAAATESVSAPPPVGGMGNVVDSVTYSSTVGQSDSVMVKGWVADPNDSAPLSNVTAYIDGTSIGTPTLGLPRLDVAAAQNNNAYLLSGFEVVSPASSLSLGAHHVTVTAIDSYGASVTLGPRAFTVAATAGVGAPFGGLDKAVDSVTFSSTVGQSNSVKISGWVADPLDDAPMSNVTVYVDGASIGTPTLGIARPDVASARGNSAYLKSGYVLLYPAATLALGAHQVTVIAIDAGGRSTTFGPLAFTVAATAGAGAPFGFIDEAVDSTTLSTTVSQSDSLEVRGWVADAVDGAPLSNVTVYVDGVSIGTPALGLPRPDVAAGLNNIAYRNCGYKLLYSASTLSLGQHVVTVVAIDSGGRSTALGPRVITVQ